MLNKTLYFRPMDGHYILITDIDPDTRMCHDSFASMLDLQKQLEKAAVTQLFALFTVDSLCKWARSMWKSLVVNKFLILLKVVGTLRTTTTGARKLFNKKASNRVQERKTTKNRSVGVPEEPQIYRPARMNWTCLKVAKGWEQGLKYYSDDAFQVWKHQPLSIKVSDRTLS